MKKRLLLSICLILFFSGFFANQTFAVIAYPGVVTMEQPDGTKLTLYIKGDEKVKWAETLDGFTILFNDKGVYEYAVLDNDGGLTLSGIAVSELSKRTKGESDLLATLEKGLRFSESQVSVMRQVWYIKESEKSKAFPTTGNRKLICILMGFKDKAFTKTQAEFNNLFNQVNYTTGGATGSVKDFYLESSYNQFTLDVTVAGPYTAANNMSYYGGNSGGNDVNPRALVTEAVTLADASVNYANYDNDNDGTVDGVYIIYAGYGEEAGGGADAIWAHAWSITPVTKDGKSISKYSCSAELRGSSGSTITAIGVICHEFGHVLGAPDYYDTDYATGGQFDGTGKWDMMAGGSWNNNGVTPAQHNAYTKIFYYNWATATTLSSATNVTVTNSNQNKSFYRINSTTTNEFWLMENRQQVGFDAQVPGHGLIIYHVHSGIGSVGNAINATYPQRMYPVCASATSNPGSTASTYGTINGGGCPFPGTSGKTSFTDATTPNMKSWAGANTSKPITSIAENTSTKTITFSFMGGGTSDTQAPTTPTNLASSNITSSSVTLSWTASTDNVGVDHYTVYNGSTAVGNTSTTSYNVAGLSASTTYSFTVKAFDAANNASNASTAKSVTTLDVVASYCASKGTDFSYEWIAKVELNGQSKSSAGTAYSDYTSTVINLSTGSNTVTLTPGFKSSTYAEYWKIWIDFNDDKDFDDAGEELFNKNGSAAVTGTITIPTSATGQRRMRVSMKYNATQTACETFGYGEVEDYTVSFTGSVPDTQAPTAPSSLAGSNVTTSGCTLSWTASTDNVGVDHYTVYKNGTSIGNTSSTSFSVTGLAASTTYSFTVKAFDAAGNVSAASNTATVTTSGTTVTYCASKGSNFSYEWISKVVIAGVTKSSAGAAYSDFTSTVINLANGSNSVALTPGFSGSTYTEYWKIWIDFNKDGDFTDAGEELFGTSSNAAVSGTITIPSSASGTTRMRVTMKYNAAPTSCETFSYGEVEDYTVSFSSSAPEFIADKADSFARLFPNPVSNVLNIEFNATMQSDVKVYSVDGKLVEMFKVTSNNMELNVSDYAPGLYLLQYTKENKSKVERFVKK